MLQLIYQKHYSPRASSIYCQWIVENRNGRDHLVAVWMGTQMACFAGERPVLEQAEHLLEDALDEPGGLRVRFFFARAA